MSRTLWRKSSHSGTGSQSECVEVANILGNIAVRDSQDADGPKLLVSRDSFLALVAELKR
ncbi:DUF397 domain-containing protein [Spirillospora sp. NPDC048819]|uniref:DUF397 domain-containing protein n=1 Tax=Spirillospora sp. NPDC048819 TaxID=3155268 RepID=UPI003404DDA5